MRFRAILSGAFGISLLASAGFAQGTSPAPILYATAQCERGRVSGFQVANTSSELMTFVSGRFVLETKRGKGDWTAGADLGSFFAELVPPGQWREAQFASVKYCDSIFGELRLRIVQIVSCRFGKLDMGTACAQNFRVSAIGKNSPFGSVPVVYLPY